MKQYLLAAFMAVFLYPAFACDNPDVVYEGTHSVNGLTVTESEQTWRLHRDAVLQTDSGEPLISVEADGFRLCGGTLKPGGRPAILSEGYSVEVRDVYIQGGSWGIHVRNAELILIDVTIRDSLHGGVLWQTDANRYGPRITNLTVLKWDAEKYGSHGGVHIRGNNAWVLSPKIHNSLVKLVQGNNYSAVGIECIRCRDANISGNSVEWGRIGISLGNNRMAKIQNNHVWKSYDYLYEIAQQTAMTVLMGNTGLGGDGLGRGVEESNSWANIVEHNYLHGIRQ